MPEVKWSLSFGLEGQSMHLVESSFCCGLFVDSLNKQDLMQNSVSHGQDFPQPFHSQDLTSNSLYCLPYNSHNVNSENLVLNQPVIPDRYFSLFSSLVCSISYWFCKEKFCLGHLRGLKGLSSLQFSK